MDKLQELLTITMEECGELVQACSKAIRCDDYYDNKKRQYEFMVENDIPCLETFYVKNKKDIENFARGNKNVRFLKGWRFNIFGKLVQ